VIILNSCSWNSSSAIGSALGSIDSKQIIDLTELLHQKLPPGLTWIAVMMHHPITRRNSERLGTVPARWWNPWAWRTNEMYEYGTLGQDPDPARDLANRLESASAQRPGTQFLVITGHRHSLWIGTYGNLWIIEAPSLAAEYHTIAEPFPRGNRMIVAWREAGQLRLGLSDRASWK